MRQIALSTVVAVALIAASASQALAAQALATEALAAQSRPHVRKDMVSEQAARPATQSANRRSRPGNIRVGPRPRAADAHRIHGGGLCSQCI